MSVAMNLTDKEQQILTLYIVKGCLEIAEQNEQDFEDVLQEEFLACNPYRPFINMVYENINILKENGCIDGYVEIEYETIENRETHKETVTTDVDTYLSTIEDISITKRGEMAMQLDQLKDSAKDFGKKALPVLKYLGSSALAVVTESLIIGAFGAIGIHL